MFVATKASPLCSAVATRVWAHTGGVDAHAIRRRPGTYYSCVVMTVLLMVVTPQQSSHPLAHPPPIPHEVTTPQIYPW